MILPRVMPVLLLKNGGLYKGIQFKKHTYVGDPINTVRIFNEKEVDEIIVLDIEASTSKTEPNYELLSEMASEAFMPLSYGGGVNSLEIARNIFSLGVEKVVLGTAPTKNINIINDISSTFGSQSVSISIEARKNIFGAYQLRSLSGKRKEKQDLLTYIQDVQNSGAGEIFLNSIDNDGMKCGYDIELLRKVRDIVHVPLVVCGGAWSLSHLKEAFDNGADSVAAGSMFVHHGIHSAVLISYPKHEMIVKTFGEINDNM